MSQKHLTSIYRPQTFAQVVGQGPISKILSRAAREEKIAPAYMFSGTRGVGKTSIARILAKAINCRQGPAAEPCNKCEFCSGITQGISLDVYEIDGASHTGVDNVRKLNEEVGYAPIELRYKVIIIDEAHMLSKPAFNALLKTLEEPPPHVTFILATTEPHKFPATIVSRCQHYVFKRVPQRELEEFLVEILNRQEKDFERSAVSVLAKKGGGSVRDCLSLLSQIMALGEGKVTLEGVRELLGIAGHEIMFELVQSIRDRDCLRIVELTRHLLNSGLDLGFFLQEFTNVWRNLFILKQGGERALELLEMPEEEARNWLQTSAGFTLSYIHAAWQMTLEGQKNVMHSLEPGLAMELLFLNISYLSDLIPVQNFNTLQDQAGEAKDSPDPGKKVSGSKPSGNAATSTRESSAEYPAATGGTAEDKGSLPADEQKDWQGFLEYVQTKRDGSISLPNLNLVQGERVDDTLELSCPKFLSERLKDKEKFNCLQSLVREYFQKDLQISIQGAAGTANRGTNGELKKNAMQDPVVKEVMDEFQAKLLDVLSRD
ncbi:MAG: DNA polymerase III subunit gamma/tau [Thermodesulfobacteriota bacterium]